MYNDSSYPICLYSSLTLSPLCPPAFLYGHKFFFYRKMCAIIILPSLFAARPIITHTHNRIMCVYFFSVVSCCCEKKCECIFSVFVMVFFLLLVVFIRCLISILATHCRVFEIKKLCPT